MDIDQRLDRLTERHEALVQYIELSAHESRENFAKTQTQINATVAQLDRVVATISTLASTISEVSATVSELTSTVAELGAIARSHERRTDRLETHQS